MNTPLGDEPSVWLTGDDKAVALLEAILAIEKGEHDEVKAVRAAYVVLHTVSHGLSARDLLVLNAGFCIATPLQAFRMHGRTFGQQARNKEGYCLKDEVDIRSLVIEKLTILVEGRTANLGRLINDYFSLLALEKYQAEQSSLQLA